MDLLPKIKPELNEETPDDTETVDCEMDIDIFDTMLAKEKHDHLDVIESNYVSRIAELYTKELLVYTTRLDDMHIWWNNLNTMYREEVTELIMKESKPKYYGHYENTTQNEQHRRTFSSLKDKIEEINCLPNKTNVISINLGGGPISLSKRSKELLRSCKPLSIVLQDFMINFHERYNEPRCLPKENIYRPLSFETRNKKFTPKPEDIRQNIRDYISKNKTGYVILKDLCSKDSTVYLVSNDVNPTEYYRFNKNNKENHYIYENSAVPVMEINSCCWYNRKQIINELSTSVCCRSIFMRIQHSCAPGRCECCCIKRYNDEQTTSPSYAQPPVRCQKRATQNNTWQDNLLNRLEDVSKWIDRALRYKAKPRQKNRKKCQISGDYDTNTILQIEHVYVNGATCSFYTMGGPDGNIDTHVELKGTLHFSKKHIHCYIRKSKARTSSQACCWYQYNMFLSDLLRFVQPSVIKFMTRSHKCAPRKCVCCCKSKAISTEKNTLKLCPVNFPIQLKYTNSYKKNIRQGSHQPITSSNYVPTTSNNVAASRNITSTIIKVTDQTSAKLPVSKTVSHNIAPTSSRIKDLSSVVPPLAPLTKSGRRNITTFSTPRIIDTPITMSAVSQTDSQTKPSDEVLNRVLSGLKGLSLVIHSDNTVTADLDDTTDNLSSENLKILKLLLRYADAYMKNRNFTSAAPIRISNIFSNARKNVGVIEYPTIVLDDDEDDSNFTLDHVTNITEASQIRPAVPRQQTTEVSQLPTGSNVTQFQDQFVKNIEKINSESTSPESVPPAPTGQTQDQYELCTNILYEKRVQYHNSVLSLLNSGNENLFLDLHVPLNRDNKEQDLASCIVEFQCCKHKQKNITHSKVGQKRKALNNIEQVPAEKKNKLDSNTVTVSTSNMTRLPFRTITLPSGITNLQENLSMDSQAMIPITFVNPESGQAIANANIPLSLLSASSSLDNTSKTRNSSDMVVEPTQPTKTVQSVDPLQKVVCPTPVTTQTQTGGLSASTAPTNNMLLSRLLTSNPPNNNIPKSKLNFEVESENSIITGIIQNQDSKEDSILGV